MLDHQNGAPGRDFLDELRDAVHVLVAHALRGLVQQHEFGLHGQRGGNLQRALAAIGQVDGELVGQVFQAHFGEQLHGALIELAQAALAAPEMERRAQLALQANAHVLAEGQVGKHRRNLERTDHAPAGNLRRCLAGDVVAVEADGARGGLQKLGQQIEAGGFACTVGADQGMDGAPAHRQCHVADRGKALELFGQVLGFKYDVAHCALAAPCKSTKRAPMARPRRCFAASHPRAHPSCKHWG